MTSDEATRFKAALWHKQVANLLRDAMPLSNGSESSQHTDGGLGVDVPVFQLATRVGQLPNVRNALREAQRDVPEDRLPLAVVRDEGHQMTFVAMPLDAFLLLVAGWWAATQPPPPGSTALAPPAPTHPGVVQ